MEKQPAIFGRYEAFIIALLLLGLYLTSLYGYLLFHSLAELFSILVALAIFVVAWNSRQFMSNNYLLFIGIAFLFIAIIDIAHTLAFKGMNIFQGYDANLPTQLWIAARYIQSLSLLIAPVFFGRRFRISIVIPAYAAVTVLALMSIFYWHNFPTCYIEGVGLTPFKKISEYIICSILLGSIATLYWKRREFDKEVFRLLVASIAFAIATELMFTLYVGVYGIFNLVGHLLRIISFYLIYKAIVETGLMRPYQFLFRDLKQSEEEVRTLNAELEQKVKERTEQLQKTLDSLKESEAMLKRITDNMSDLIGQVDLEGKFVYASPSYLAIAGYPTEEILGKYAFDMIHPDDTPALIAYSQELIQNPSPATVEFRFRHADGRYLWVDARGNPLFDDGKLVGFVFGSRDITERKRTEAELAKYRDHLEQLVGERTKELTAANERLQELDRLKSVFIASMSHELRTPLNSIIGFTGILLQGLAGPLNEEQQKQLGMVKGSSKHLLALINDVIDVSKIESEKIDLIIEDFDLSHLITEVKSSFEVAISDKGLLLHIDNPDKCTIRSDERRVKQIIMNLVSNALKYTDKGAIKMKLVQADGKVKIIVTDSGIGIRAEDMPRLFEQFSRITLEGQDIREGTGLGLYLSQKLADILGGEIRAESRFGKGSEFTLILPTKYKDR